MTTRVRFYGVCCPFCGHRGVRVTQTWGNAAGDRLYRRRACPSCGVTWETVEQLQSGARQEGDEPAPERRESVS